VSLDQSDAQFHERLVAGDDDALAEVYDLWSPLVHTVALRVTGDRAAAEDVTQDVFVHLWERPEKYDPQRGALRSWLCMLARSRALDSNRRRQVRARYHATAGAMVTDQAKVDDAITWEAEVKVVRSAVETLPEPQRAALLLAYYQGHTYREVARELEIPEGTAKSRMRVALATVAKRLTAEGIIER
jgi:RNA polymerase sigma factor (sigma-70 family)